MNGNIKPKNEAECKLYSQYIKNGRFKCDFVFLETLITDYSEVISSTKALYYEILPKN